ncbi:MAG TPA: efflux RND transporter periplasmic adaptor subunit [Candidatus Angelobacter sp.]
MLRPCANAKLPRHPAAALSGRFDGLIFAAIGCVCLNFLVIGCGRDQAGSAGSPPPVKVEQQSDSNVIKVDRPERFSMVAVGEYDALPALTVTGVVSPDVSRMVPVMSLASGRVVEIHARLGDAVRKGQLLMRVRSTDIASAFSDYRKAVADETLARSQLDRAKVLYDKGAISKNDLQIAQDAEDKARVDTETTQERLRALGAGPDHPSPIVDISAPAAGVITDQQVTLSSAIQAFGTPSPFTISDLSRVWIICDVYENDMSFVQLGEYADVRLNAYPDKPLKGRIGNIAPILDPNIRTAKVRLELPNPGLMRAGMFVTATFHGKKTEKRATVPAAAILHLHDRDWVYVAVPGGQFRRVEVRGGEMLPGGWQEIISGIQPGQQVVANALELQNTVEQ